MSTLGGDGGASGEERLAFLDGRITVRVAQADNADALSVLEHDLPCGSGPPTHVHHDEDEIFHVIEGEVQVQIGEVRHLARAGQTLIGPRGVPHAFRVTSPHGARMLSITRGGFEAMVRSVSRPAVDPRPASAEAPSPAEQALLAQACGAQRIDLVGPPLAA